MEASEIDEFGFIGRRKKRSAANTQRVRLGMGDDAPVSLTPGNRVVATVALLLERICFSLSPISPQKIGRKSLAVNLSNIAAMEGVPQYGTLSLSVPARMRAESLDEFHAGLLELADPFEAFLAGGKPSVSPGHFFLNFWKGDGDLGERKSDRLFAVHWIGSFRKSGDSRGGEGRMRSPAIARFRRLRFQRMGDRTPFMIRSIFFGY